VFCGYSLPDADLHIKYLLKRAELNRQGAPPEVYIVNGRDEECRKRQREDERERYLRLWRDPSLLHFKNLSFEDLCQLWPDAFFDAPEI
jgi:hypothetical protein